MEWSVRWLNQWPAIFALGEGFNWVDLTIVELTVEWKRYAGRYYEGSFVIFGLGVYARLYEPIDYGDLVRAKQDLDEAQVEKEPSDA